MRVRDCMYPVGALTPEEYRFRVIAVRTIGGRHIFHDKVREYRTRRAAAACQRRWLTEGRRVLLQTGVLHWHTTAEDQDDQRAAADTGKGVSKR